MSEIEITTLRRAALLLLALSAARALTSVTGPKGTPVDAAPGFAALLDSTKVAAADAERRTRPLGPAERIDPNTAPEPELDRLPGVGPVAAASIVAARDTGLVFRESSDLTAVRGIGPATVARLEPHLDLTGAPAGRTTLRRRVGVPDGGRGASTTGARPRPVDVNRAGVEELQALPGVGPVLAERIVRTRVEGAFRSLDDLVRVPGIGAATVSRLRGLAVVGRDAR